MNRSWLRLAALALLLMLTAAPALASAAEAYVPVKILADGALPDPAEEYVIELTAEKSSAPMPEGAEGRTALLTITGPGEGSFGPIDCTRPGQYQYTVRQRVGELPNGVYDQQTYRATLSVYRDNGTLTALVVLYQGDSSDKLHTATFRNVYAALPTPEPTATPTTRPTPRPTDGSLTPTGVEDHWPLYLAGMAVLAVIACAMIVVLCRKERHDEPQKR